jgi:hypothetical protein
MMDHEHFCVGTAEHVIRNCARKAPTLVASDQALLITIRRLPSHWFAAAGLIT